MRIGVTGAAGYIGQWLTACLHNRDHQVFAQDAWAPRREPPWPFQRFDLHDADRRARWIHNSRLDVVIHLAALYGRVWGERDMSATAGTNAGLTGALARDCTILGPRLMFVSSSEVYGRSADEGPVSTCSPLRPYNMYGLSKKWGEEAARLYAGDGLMIARLNMPYGPPADVPDPGQRPHTSGIPGPLGYNVLHSMLWQAEHGMDLHVHTGTTRCLTWVGDSVRGLAMIAESDSGGVWNVCRDDDHRPVLDIAERVVKLTGSRSAICPEPVPLGVTLQKHLDNLDLLNLGWKPETSLDDGMAQSWVYYRRFDRDGYWRGLRPTGQRARSWWRSASTKPPLSCPVRCPRSPRYAASGGGSRSSSSRPWRCTCTTRPPGRQHDGGTQRGEQRMRFWHRLRRAAAQRYDAEEARIRRELDPDPPPITHGTVRRYGDTYVDGELIDRTTIHGSGTIDIQTDALGHPVAVWFRCRTLPFTVSEAMEGREAEVQPEIAVTAIEYVEPR